MEESADVVPVNALYIGDGGQGKSIAILPPDATGLTEDYIPAIVQGELITCFKNYTAMEVPPREVSLDKMYKDILNPKHEETAAAGMDLGHLTPPDYYLNGTIIKTNRDYVLQFDIIRSDDKFIEAPYSGRCTFGELENNYTGIRRAFLELLSKMGIEPTERTRTELTKDARPQTVMAQTADARGYTADWNNRTAEAALYYTQAAVIDPSMLQTASRASTLTANIASGDIGASTREQLQQYDDWLALLKETEETIYKLIDTASTNPPYTLYYSTGIQWGDINFQTRRRDAHLEMNLRGLGYWFDSVRIAAQSVYGAVYDGLNRTGYKDRWGFGNWPNSGVTRRNPFGTSWRHDINVVFELVNDQGKSIGRQTYSRRTEYSPRRDGNQVSISYREDDYATVTFSAIQAADISDQLTIRIVSVNGKEPQLATGSISLVALSGDEWASIKALMARYSQGVIGESNETFSGDLIIPAAIWEDYPVTAIADNAFQRNQLTSVIIPDSVVSIGANAFAYNDLTSVTIPEGVAFIGEGAFAGNKLTYVYVPDSIVSQEAKLVAGGVYGVSYDPGVPAIHRGTFATGAKGTFIPMILFGELTSSTYTDGFSISLPADIRYQRNDFATLFLLSTVIHTDPLGSFYTKNDRQAGTYIWDGQGKKWLYWARR
jgi:hypothetical protein